MEYEKPAVEAAGLRYVNIPMVDKSYPSMDQVNAFLKVVDDPATGKFFLHCAGGRHRTGVMGAVYRFNHDGWTFDQVLCGDESIRLRFRHGPWQAESFRQRLLAAIPGKKCRRRHTRPVLANRLSVMS